MPQFDPDNERIKRQYIHWCSEADGKDEKTLDAIAATLRDFELALGCKSFKAFHRDWAKKYKTHLSKARHHRTKKPLGLATRDARLRQVKAFFKWLASQPGYKSRISFSDVEYFNNKAKDARAAHAKRPALFPSMEQCAHAFRNMPCETAVQQRDKAAFALLMLTGARDSALASLRLQHVDLVERLIFQDGRTVNTKNAKTIETWFLPVDEMYLQTFEEWVTALRSDHLFGPADAIFPKPKRELIDSCFNFTALSRDPYANGQKINAVIKGAFSRVGLHPYHAHSFRRTLALYGDSICSTREAFKAWSQNIGHEHMATTVSAYMPVSRERQRDLIRNLGEKVPS
jgi:integrase